jgi:hypothetical protein
MAGTAHPFGSRAAMEFFALAAAAVMALWNPASTVCNQVCSDGRSNTFFGDNAGISTTGSDNPGFGFDALSSNTTGSLNTATEADALLSNTAGAFNTAAGVDVERSTRLCLITNSLS